MLDMSTLQMGLKTDFETSKDTFQKGINAILDTYDTYAKESVTLVEMLTYEGGNIAAAKDLFNGYTGTTAEAFTNILGNAILAYWAASNYEASGTVLSAVATMPPGSPDPNSNIVSAVLPIFSNVPNDVTAEMQATSLASALNTITLTVSVLITYKPPPPASTLTTIM